MNNTNENYIMYPHLRNYYQGRGRLTTRPFQFDFVSQKTVTNPSISVKETTNFWHDEELRSAHKDNNNHSVSFTRIKEEEQRCKQEWLRQQEYVRQHDEEPRSTHKNNNGYSLSFTRTEKEKQRRIQEWLRQQQREKQHEKLKQQKILEYERKRAQKLELAKRKPSPRSKSDSISPLHHQYRRQSTSNASKSDTLCEKLDESSSSQGIQISTTELRRIKVNVGRNILTKGSISELQRDIDDPENVVIKRRKGEGCKPIFDRKEIKNAVMVKQHNINIK